MNWDNVYSGAADLGRVYSTIGLVAGLIIGVILIVIGISMLLKKPDPDPVFNSDPMSTSFQQSETNSNTLVGWSLIGTGIVVIVIAWLIWHFTQVSKPFAATEGALGTVEMVKDIFTPSPRS